MTSPVAPVPAGVVQAQARVAELRALTGTDPSRRGHPFDRVLAAQLERRPADTGAVRAAGVLGARGDLGGAGAAALVAAARDYEGIPYVWGGTDPATGLDCSGFTQHLYRRFGVELPRVSADQVRTGAPVAGLDAALPGDLLGWDTGPRNQGADHVAVYLGGGMMIEASTSAGRVRVAPVREPDYIRRVLPAQGATAAAGSAGAVAPASSASLPAATPFAGAFVAAGARNGVDPTLLALVAERESGFRPDAVSPAGAQGLMQLMPATARAMGVVDPFDPVQSIEGAARLLSRHLDRFGTVPLALAAYSAGEGAVARHGGVPPYDETRRYVEWMGARYGGTGRWT